MTKVYKKNYEKKYKWVKLQRLIVIKTELKIQQTLIDHSQKRSSHLQHRLKSNLTHKSISYDQESLYLLTKFNIFWYNVKV